MKATVGPVVEAVSDPSALRIMRTARSRTSAKYLLFLPMVTILPREMVSGKPGAIQRWRGHDRAPLGAYPGSMRPATTRQVDLTAARLRLTRVALDESLT